MQLFQEKGNPQKKWNSYELVYGDELNKIQDIFIIKDDDLIKTQHKSENDINLFKNTNSILNLWNEIMVAVQIYRSGFNWKEI